MKMRIRSSIKDFEDDLRVDPRWSLPSTPIEGEDDNGQTWDAPAEAQEIESMIQGLLEGHSDAA